MGSRTAMMAVAAALVTGCNGAPVQPVPQMVQVDWALGRSIERDASAPLQTDQLVYSMAGSGIWYRVYVPFRYRNDTGRTISIVNCHGGLNIGLEKRVEDRWEPFYRPVLLLCVSPPIAIEPGVVFTYTAGINGALPGMSGAPAFGSVELEGEYRLVWGNLVHEDEASSGGGSPIGPLHSNPFLVVVPE